MTIAAAPDPLVRGTTREGIVAHGASLGFGGEFMPASGDADYGRLRVSARMSSDFRLILKGMRRPPWVSDSDLRAAIQRIHDRHERDDNDYCYLLSEDPLEVLTYLQRLGCRGLVGDVKGHDVKDALILRVWLWWKGEQVEVWLLQQAEELGLNRKDVGRILNLATGQGLVDRIDIKRRMLSSARPGNRGQSDLSTQRLVGAQRQWAAANRDAVQAIAQVLVEHWNLVEDDEEATEWLEEVQRDLRDQACTPGVVNLIRLAVEAMGNVARVQKQPPGHPLQQAVTSWRLLIRSYPPGIEHPAVRVRESVSGQAAADLI